MSGDLIGGRYLLQRSVGRGAMGTVWLGTDQTLHRDVAVKQMGSMPGEDAAGTARAMREARSAAAMNHRNAVSIYDVVDHENAPWLVMEYFPSRTLGDIIKEDGPISPERAAHIGAQVADALSDAHKLGIMHRDVKPSNILVGDGDHAKISDFGIARAEMDATLTQTGMMTGTPAYLAPEQATGGSPSTASDVWALGASIYAAVEGEPPYGTQGNPLQVLSRIVSDPVPRPDHAGPLLPILGDMLSKDPRSRPTMAEAASRLADLDAGAEPPANRTRIAPMPPPPTPTWTTPADSAYDGGGGRRRLLPIALAVLLILALAVGGWALLGGGDDNTATSDQSGPSHRPDKPKHSNDNSQPTQSEPSETPTTESQPTQNQNGNDNGNEQAGGDPAGFVEHYYSLMPNDTNTGWQMLGGDLKSQGKRSYEDFWSTIESVEVSNVTETSPTQVVYDITYNEVDGGSSSEHKVITLESHGDSYLIARDDPA
ncbi:MAG TPA: serine/threonine-protein kinase [Nocardioidaceae bacterium]|nr:serine/threonine-protein kinase [Nocardioidaceae bacterium]